MIKTAHYVVLLIGAFTTLLSSAWAETSDQLAARIIKAVDRPVGLAYLPRCGDGSLALAFTKADPTLIVFGQEADADQVAQARKLADQAGLLGRRIWIDQGGLDRLLPVGRSCDLVVLTDLVPGELTPALASELRRVLHPWYGVVVLCAAPGKLDPAALSAWAKTINPEVTPVSLESLVLVKAGPLPKADDWTHWWHGPDNNAVSADAAYSVPESMQWTGKPYFAPTRVELPIISQGRLFVLWNGNLLDMAVGKPELAAAEAGEGPLLTAQAVGSGQRLWVRKLSPAAWLQVARSTMVADGDRLLVADGPRILELDAATGKELRKVDLNCGEIRWMALADGRLVVLGGPATENLGNRKDIQVVPFRSSGLLLLALQRDTMKELWRVQREKGPEAFDPRSPAVSGGRIFVCTEGGKAEAFDLAYGKPLWQTATGIKRHETQTYDWDRVSRHPVAAYALQGMYLVSGLEADHLVALDQVDGRKKWELAKRGSIPLTTRGLVWLGGTGLDPETGTMKTTIEAANRSCGRYTACPQGMIGGGLSWDWLAEKPYPLLSAKSACGPNSFVANGLIWKFPTPCSGCTEWRGFIVRAAGEKPPAPPARLIAGSQVGTAGAEASGWLSHRADVARSASTPAAIAEKAKILWSVPPAHPFGPVSGRGTVLFDTELVPVPPVLAGKTAIVAGRDGAVTALNLDTGQTCWRTFLGSGTMSSPTIWKDRVLVGSVDGCLYALALADGRELWRLRAAPEAGRAMVFGLLGSRWPILTSPLVVDDRVYVTAGLLDGVDGVYAVAADANAGTLLWERRDWAEAKAAGKMSGAGQWCADGAAVFFHGGENPPVELARKDGACGLLLGLPTDSDIKKNKLNGWNLGSIIRGGRGQELGSPAADWLVYGGRRQFTDEAETGTWGLKISFLSRKAPNGLPLLRVEECELMPAWDGQDVLFILDIKRINQLALIPRIKLERALETRLMEGSKREGPLKETAYLQPISLDKEDLIRWRVPMPFGTTVLGCALAKNAAVALSANTKSAQVSAYSRTDGAKMWSFPLPSKPVHDGLAVAPDGRVIVNLCDGMTVCVGPEK